MQCIQFKTKGFFYIVKTWNKYTSINSNILKVPDMSGQKSPLGHSAGCNSWVLGVKGHSLILMMKWREILGTTVAPARVQVFGVLRRVTEKGVLQLWAETQLSYFRMLFHSIFPSMNSKKWVQIRHKERTQVLSHKSHMLCVLRWTSSCSGGKFLFFAEFRSQKCFFWGRMVWLGVKLFQTC